MTHHARSLAGALDVSTWDAGALASAVLGRLLWAARWCLRHVLWLACWGVVASLAWLVGEPGTAGNVAGVALAPCLLGCVWSGLSPRSYERLVAGPARRFGWWWSARIGWTSLARRCGLSMREPVTVRRDGRKVTDHRWLTPTLRRVRIRGNTLTLTITARPGQTLADLEQGAERIAPTLGALSHGLRPGGGSRAGDTLVVELVMRDTLGTAATAAAPEPRVGFDLVRLGRSQGGRVWQLALRGRHTLVAGCSGAGKGSILWGIVGALAPAVKVDIVRLWGVDLKRGVELAMGAPLFSATAYTPADALRVLRALMEVIDQRGATMAGHTRLHQPVPGDPLHVLVIDELAALTAYADHETRREANRLLSEVLTQGRALGVVVLACVQDPSKETVSMRGLFTQTLALRLRSAEETIMVLGDGMTHKAPAHRISPAHPGIAWVVEDNGAVDRVRADYWPDDLIREVARRYPTPVAVTLPEVVEEPRPPRAARAPRSPRAPKTAAVSEGAA